MDRISLELLQKPAMSSSFVERSGGGGGEVKSWNETEKIDRINGHTHRDMLQPPRYLDES